MMKLSYLLLTILSSGLLAHTEDHSGVSGFSTTSPENWYTLETNSYPEVTPLSLGGNRGDARGGVYPSPTGITIGEAGDYWINIMAILQNPAEDSTILVPIFLVRNEIFDPENDNTPVGGIVTLRSQEIITHTSTGIVRNLTPGTRLSLVATNAGYPLPQSVVVVAWGITLHKL